MAGFSASTILNGTAWKLALDLKARSLVRLPAKGVSRSQCSRVAHIGGLHSALFSYQSTSTIRQLTPSISMKLGKVRRMKEPKAVKKLRELADELEKNMPDGKDFARELENRPFSKMAAENLNKSKLKTNTSTRKSTFTLVTLASFSISGEISAEKM